MRICLIGDELVAGTGDPRALGWVGRVAARSLFPVPPVMMPLAVPGEDSTAMAARWEREVVPRLVGEEDARLVVSLGVADVVTGVSASRTRLNLANILDEAAAHRIPCMLVGPPPLAGVDHGHLTYLTKACSEVAGRRGVPFVDIFTPLRAHDQWFEDMAASPARSVHGATLPGQAGHALIAWLVLHQGWYEWTGSDPRE